MYYNIVKRNSDTDEFITIVKTFTYKDKLSDNKLLNKAHKYCRRKNWFGSFTKKHYYYMVEIDFE